MKIKENFKESITKIRNSKMVTDAIEKLYPTFDVIKNKGGYKIVLGSILITLIAIPLQLLIGFVSKILLGTSMLAGFSLTSYGSIDMILRLIRNGALGKLIAALIIVLIIWLISFIITTFMLGNANFRSFKVLVEEERVVGIGEYAKLSIKDIIPFAWKYFLNVTLPIILINLAGGIADYIPYIKGSNIAYFITMFGAFALKFRFYSIMLELKHENVISKFIEYWLTYAVVVYLVNICISFNILSSFMNIAFILYSVLVLTNNNSYSNEEKPLLDTNEETI